MAVRNLPSHLLEVAGGLRTNFNPRENVKNFLRVAQNVDTYDVFNETSKIPGSTRVSAQHPTAVSSLHYFEYSSLTGARTRERLSLSGGTLYKINDDLSITSLTTGLASEPLAAITSLDRIHLTGRAQLALPTGGIKYDGANVRSWGIVAPGSRAVTKLAFDDANIVTPSTDATKSTNTATKKDLVASVQVNKVGTATSEAYIDHTGLALNLSDGGNSLFLWLFIPAGALQKLAPSGTAVEIRYGGAALTNSDSHFFSVGELIQGWNLLTFDRTARDALTGTGATLGAISVFRTRLVFATNPTTQSGFLWDLLFGVDRGNPAGADSGVGLIAAGTYRYRYTYVTEQGFESNAGPASTGVTIAINRQIGVTNIGASVDLQVIARRLYRDLNGDGIFRFVDQIDNNVSTTFTDNLPSASLGLSQPPLAGDPSLDNSPPEAFLDVELFNNRAWGISARDRFVLIPSNIGQPEGFPIVDQLLFEEELVGVESHAFGLIIYATDKVFLLNGLGTTDDPITVVEATNQSGANGFRAKGRVKGTNITVRETEAFFLGDPRDPWFINGPILKMFRDQLPATGLASMHVVHDRSRFRVVFFGIGAGGKYTENFVYQYGTTGRQEISGQGPGVDPQDLRYGSWRTLGVPASVNPLCSEMVERTDDKQELWAGAEDGYVYWLGDPSATNFATQLTSAPIDSIIGFADVPLGAGGEPDSKGKVTHIKLCGTFASQTTWTVQIDLLNAAGGRIRATKSFDIVFPAGDQMKRQRIGFFGCKAEYARVQLRNATSGGTGRFREVRLYFSNGVDFAGPGD